VGSQAVEEHALVMALGFINVIAEFVSEMRAHGDASGALREGCPWDDTGTCPVDDG